MWIRAIRRSWTNSGGETIEKTYFYWYRSRRIGLRVVSECIGKASEEDYLKYLADKQSG